ncbi:hypothetical protein [Bradyrhizobium icense]|uniref:AraC family transcriptional regulator n=1 Tax=Bradyrhizobium icense TaxID=1274631 RepID=A0A1B1UJV2_9BRAD|nr:hypothetical protein [Bradyrhizobium icense]ANW03072.1 hypothetical protein LMTR13_25905 [Bradyrhizobium icense]
MCPELDDRLRLALMQAADLLTASPESFTVLFRRGDLWVELFASRWIDTQQPHEQDEIYTVVAGTGVFPPRRGPRAVWPGRLPVRTGTRAARLRDV